jgi:hypothetical protein
MSSYTTQRLESQHGAKTAHSDRFSRAEMDALGLKAETHL